LSSDLPLSSISLGYIIPAGLSLADCRLLRAHWRISRLVRVSIAALNSNHVRTRDDGTGNDEPDDGRNDGWNDAGHVGAWDAVWSFQPSTDAWMVRSRYAR
jgi:hypothetical protein